MNDVAEYLEEMTDRESQAEVHSVEELLDEMENETLYRALLVGLTTGAIYARLDHLRKKLKKIL